MINALLENKETLLSGNELESQRLASILIPRLRTNIQTANFATPNALLVKSIQSSSKE
jgi:hypothetical protein